MTSAGETRGDPVRPPSRSLGCLALGLSVLALGCAAFHYGPLLSLAVSVYALVMISREPDRYAGRGMAAGGLALSLMAGFFVITMRPYFNNRGELRYGAIMDQLDEKSREANVIGSLRTFASAETAFALEHHAGFGTIECLTTPVKCNPPLAADAPAYLMDWPPGYVERDFTVTFLPTAAKGPKATEGRLERVAVTFVPKTPGKKLKAYCGDSDGNISVSADGSVPRVVDGLCDPATRLP